MGRQDIKQMPKSLLQVPKALVQNHKHSQLGTEK